jgi:hypothetical protein
MASNKSIILNDDVLLEYSYDATSKADNYNIIYNLKDNTRQYASKLGLNSIDYTIFPIDVVLDKFAKIDTVKYNFLKIESYASSLINFDTLKFHFPTSYSFNENGYIGYYARIYTYDYNNRYPVTISSFIYDDTDIIENKNMTLNNEFIFNEVTWGKYVTYDIPSINAISQQRDNTNNPTANSINKNIFKPDGISTTAPIFIEFAFIINKETILGNTYYYLVDKTTKSISKIPEYFDLGVVVEKAEDGDYYKIYGTYGTSNQLLDNFINELNIKGRKVEIQYKIDLYEENILMCSETRIVEDNYTKIELYRPIISFSNTTASIDVTMSVIDLIDMSQIIREASISLRNELFKYGKKLTKINIDNAYNPKIYNLKKSNNTNNQFDKGYKIELTKVNYPVLSDRIKILASSSPSPSTDYKSMGLAEIIINPFGNVIKFIIGKADDNDVIPFNLTEINENAQITLSFMSDTDFLELSIWQDSDQNDFENGVIIYKINQEDVTTIKKIGKSNKNFYLTIKSNNVGTRSLLYSGKWLDYNSITFVDNISINSTSGVNLNNFTDLDLTPSEIQTLNKVNASNLVKLDDKYNLSNINTKVPYNKTNDNTNLLIFLKPDVNMIQFETYLTNLKVSIYLKKPAGNSDSLVYLYFVLNVTKAIQDDIKKQIGVSDVVPIPFCLGQYSTGSLPVNPQNIKDDITNFNCDNTTI